MIEASPGAEYAVGLKVEKQKYVDYELVEKYTRWLVLLRPQIKASPSAGRIQRMPLSCQWYWNGVNFTFPTRAKAAQAAHG